MPIESGAVGFIGQDTSKSLYFWSELAFYSFNQPVRRFSGSMWIAFGELQISGYSG